VPRNASPISHRIVLLAAGLLLSFPVFAQTVSSSSSSASSTDAPAPPANNPPIDQANPALRPRAAQIEQGGAAVTLESNEPLFEMAAALNACGYDADLDKSAPVRAEVRDDMNAALAASEAARTSRDALCAYIAQHHLNDPGLNVGQYVSLALYLSPPPSLTPNLDETELPPQATQVVNVLPLLRAFAADVQLHFIWLHHHAEYDALLARVHDPMTQAILSANIYLHQPVSSYDGRRFLVLLEPMLSPSLTNARVYGSDYIIVMSPDNSPGVPVPMDQIRHIYLHYVVEPMVYSRGTAMERMQPLLRGVQDAPLEFFYKSDVVALMTESLIKAIEARMYVIAGPAPAKPKSKDRADLDEYAALKDVYDRETALERQKLVDTDESQGWAMAGYFYHALQLMERTGDGLRDEIAPMIYGMDIDQETKHAQQIIFVKTVPDDPLRPNAAPRKIEGMDLAELDLMKGSPGDAADLAEKALADPRGDHARAKYVIARIELMQGDPEKAMQGFQQTLALSKDPRTLAWSHIYLGRLYDIQTVPDREKAIAEYKQALALRDSRPDTKQAAESGLARPFALPRRETKPPAADNGKDFDPTGKAQKDAYKPNAPN
jgi:tetratricopeptide (TPR) repeat protein